MTVTKHYRTQVGPDGKTRYVADPGYHIVYGSHGKVTAEPDEVFSPAPPPTISNPAANPHPNQIPAPQQTYIDQHPQTYIDQPGQQPSPTPAGPAPSTASPVPGIGPTAPSPGLPSWLARDLAPVMAKPATAAPTTAPTSAPTFGAGSADPLQSGNLSIGNAQYDPFGTAQMYGTILDGTKTVVVPNKPANQFGNPDLAGIPTGTHTNTYTPGYTPTQFIQQFATDSLANRSAFESQQAALKAAGYYSSSGYTKGVYGSQDRQAMVGAMNDYLSIVNSNSPVQMTFSQFLQLKASAGAGSNGGGGSGRRPLTISYTDPAELTAALQSGAQSALGRKLTSSEMSGFITGFHAKEAAAETQAYNGGGTATMPEVTGQAQNFLDTHFQGEEQQRLKATYLDAMNSMFGVK